MCLEGGTIKGTVIVKECPGDLIEAPVTSILPGGHNCDFRLITQVSRVSLPGLAWATMQLVS